MRRRAVLAGLLGLGLAPAAAQAPPDPPAIQLPVVVLDREALFSRSQFGQRVRADIAAASEQLVAENRRIEEELEAEERALTERRATEDAATFRDLADAFDQKVEGIRNAQDAKGRAIANQTERAQQLFLEESAPILNALAQEVGAIVILDRRMVIAASDQVDITALAITRIDASLGEGESVQIGPSPRPPEEAEAEPDPAPQSDR